MPRSAVPEYGNWFAPGGPLSDAHPGYEHRPQQEEMARRVHAALWSDGRLAVEAGTGVGKSLAYLVPACEWARQTGKRVAVSTYTRVLQSQLISQDIPLARKVLGEIPRVAVAYGQDNYLCKFRLHSRISTGLFDTREQAKAADLLLDWAAKTEDGVLLHAPFALPASVRRRVGRDSAACRKKDCPFFGECFFFKARRKWRESGVLVVNHALFFAAFSSQSDVLPELHAVVFDEAHRIEDACVRHFGVQVSQARLASALDQLEKPRRGLLYRLPYDDERRAAVLDLVRACRADAGSFFDRAGAGLPPEQNRQRLRDAIPATPEASLRGLSDAVREVAKDADDELVGAELAAISRELGDAAAAVERFSKPDPDFEVYWIERNAPGRTSCISAPLDVAPILREQVYPGYSAVVMTSATLTVAGDFAFMSSRIGLDRFETLLLDSPFDHRNRSLLYCSPKLPDPTRGEYVPAVAGLIPDIIRTTRGRALVLFTSYEMMDRVREQVPEDDYPLLCQSDLPVPELLRRFREDTHSVLFATQSFWQGIDVPGESLTCLVICRLPFEVPDDPRLTAIGEKLKAEGNHPFPAYQLPTAVLRLRQGYGRLLRTSTDRGVVCILDRRVLTRTYGSVFLKSLPRVPLVTDLRRVEAFLAGETDR